MSNHPAKTLQALAPDERLVVEMLSVFSNGEPISMLTRALAKVGHRVSGRSPKNGDILPIVQSLTKRGVVDDDGGIATAGLAHLAMLALAREGRLERMAAVARELRPARGTGGSVTTWALALRELRIDLYARRWDTARPLLGEFPRHIFSDVCCPFDGGWIAELPADIRSHALAGIVEAATAQLEPAAAALAMLEAEPALTAGEARILVEKLVLCGRLDDAEHRLGQHASIEADVGRAWVAFLRGRTREAIEGYEAALKVVAKMAGKRNAYFPDRAGLFFVVALIAEGSAASLARATELTKLGRAAKLPFVDCNAMLSEFLDVLAGRREHEDLLYITKSYGLARQDPLEILLQAAAALWVRVKPPKELTGELEKRRAAAAAAGLHWYAAQAADVLNGFAGLALRPAGKATPGGVGDGLVGVRLAAIVSPRERWADALDTLLGIASPSTKTASAPDTESDRRLAWIVRTSEYGGRLGLEPREQTLTKGGWSKGKPVALKRLFEGARQLGFLSSADLVACAAIESETTYEHYGRYPRVHYSVDVPRALRALAGSANLLIEVSDGVFDACEVRQAVPRLEVAREGGHLVLALVPRPANDEEVVTVVATGPRTVDVVEFAPIHHAIAQALGRKPLEVPLSGEARLRAVMGALSGRIAVHAELSDNDAAPSAPGDSRPRFLLRVLGDGLLVSAHVRPLGKEGPLARPGHGGATLLAQVAGQRASATRDLAEERRRFDHALAASPVLAAHQGAPADFTLPEREGAFAALLELRALGNDVAIEWPAGGELQVSDALTSASLRLAVTGDVGTFLLRGALAIPGGKEVELTDLIDYLSASPGRFFRLSGDEAYFALTAELRTRLDEMLAISDRSARGLRIHALAVPLMANLLASSPVGVTLKACAAWQRQVERFAVVGIEPAVPSTLRAELRPYQVEGFRWLVRLSQWGAGGCLADDMGLGKTVQAVALLLHRAAEGPALVVAPTSVVPTWVDEVRRFAPTLRVRTFAGPARAKDLSDLGPFDLLVTSYALLQVDIDVLAKVEFATAVLDEAQVIKNADTKRARAAGRLKAKLRVATTGTPIENRLADLHSIFAFINPDLLGSADSFQARFARPIERAQDAHARDRLRRLVAPFILRRTKTQVLPELPARTEVTLRVPLELEETALYEAIRSEALAGLAGGDAPPGRMQLLAAILRLRRAASNARLVLPESEAPSAKLAALGEILDDLLPNQHKVLVFSQFVGHLALVKQLLDQRGVSHQYLDGNTPMGARKVAVDAFQAGQGDVFLISLKAGGVGLNLTAADYVVHMDPWWNPAVEDQASDRAHRIGQSRPVTIYRLVAQNTIEDRILALHHRKRELAAGILAGSDVAGTMSETELLALIRDPQ